MEEVPSPQRAGIPRGVPRTALYMTLIRDHESRRPNALFHDRFSAEVVAALAGTSELEQVAVGLGTTARSLSQTLDAPLFKYFAVRTRYFDDRLTGAMGAGIRQIVSLGAGLDSRPLRLACPPGTAWYELDLPTMVDIKESLIAEAGILPTCRRCGVAADLTEPFHAVLEAAGFDRREPSAWLIEGLLMYLPGEATDQLIAELTGISATPSELLLEHAAVSVLTQQAGVVQDAVKAQDAEIINARDDIASWLAGYGWLPTVHAGSDPAIGYGQTVPQDPAGWLAHARLQDRRRF